MIHPTAVIDRSARLGRNVQVGAYSIIERDVEIGDDTVIGPRVTLLPYTNLGPRCRVHAGAVLGDTPQDMAFKECESFLRIGAGTVLREGVTAHRGTKEGTATVIGEECMLMVQAHCGHNCILGARAVVANNTLLGGYVQIGERAFVSGNCLIHQFVRIGRIAMIPGGCGVSKDVPPFMTLVPLVLNQIAGINRIGLSRAGLSVAERSEIKAAFKTLYRSGLNVSQALAALDARADSAVIRELCDFIRGAKRGICAAPADGPVDDAAGD